MNNTQDKEGEDWPEELKYTERNLDMNEVLFGLNLYAHEKDEIDYSMLCLETVDVWLNRVQSSEEYSAKQNVAITLVLKGRRLLRAAQFQIYKGYLPEAEILFRSIFELQLVLSYILGDPTDNRVGKYLNFEKKKTWDFRLLCEDLLGEEAYKFYANLSQYPHPFNIGRARLIHQGKLQPSAIHDYEKAGEILVLFGNAAVGLCEESNCLFDVDPEWDKKHQAIYDTEIFQKNIQVVKKKIEQGDDALLKVISKSEDIRKNHKEK